MARFVDREQELDRPRALYQTDDAALAVVYGRRRIGKTTLVLESIKDRDDAVYYQATWGSAEQQIRSFVSDAAAVYPGITRIREERVAGPGLSRFPRHVRPTVTTRSRRPAPRLTD
jgi:AAA+ ATPase superfamily predicted ATPase